MECPYLRNVTFQKIIKVDAGLEGDLFTFGSLPINPLHDDLTSETLQSSPQFQTQSSSYQTTKNNIQNHMIVSKQMTLSNISSSPHPSLRIQQIPKLLQPQSLKELSKSRSSRCHSSQILKPINIADYQLYTKSLLKFTLPLRIFDIENLNNIQLISKQICVVEIQQSNMKIIAEGSGDVHCLNLEELKLSQHYSMGVLARMGNKGVLFETATPEEKIFYEKLKEWTGGKTKEDQKISEFQKQNIRSLSLSHLVDNANTFDILLYKSNRFMSQIQRLITNSEYDHVSMILKSSNKQTYVFDCNSTNGVTMIPFKRYKSFIKKIVQTETSAQQQQQNPTKSTSNDDQLKIYYRKFNGKIVESNILKLEDFINKSMGKKYMFSPTYLFPNTVKTNNDTYFCSELIATVLQQVGFMKTSKPAFQYLPKHFGENEIELINCSYSDPCQVSFT